MVQNWIQIVKYNWILSDFQLYIYKQTTYVSKDDPIKK